MIDIYCDGGCVGRNPSPLGGTWAWCQVENGEITRHNSGLVVPHFFGTKVKAVTNNMTELLAAVLALRAAPEGWDGVLYTDSKVTLHRLTNGTSFNGVAQWLRVAALDLRRCRKWSVQLVAGHPTRAELQEGLRRRNGLPASPWNVFCDRECCWRARSFKNQPPFLHTRVSKP